MFETFFRSAKARATDASRQREIRHAEMREAPRSTPPETKAVVPLIALTLPGRAPSWSPRDYATLVREGVMLNAIAYRCVRMIAEAAASVPWLLYEGAAEIERHPLLALLASPNKSESGAALCERGLVHHVGAPPPELEDQMCQYDGTGPSPDRMDALVWALSELFPLERAIEPRVRGL